MPAPRASNRADACFPTVELRRSFRRTCLNAFARAHYRMACVRMCVCRRREITPTRASRSRPSYEAARISCSAKQSTRAPRYATAASVALSLSLSFPLARCSSRSFVLLVSTSSEHRRRPPDDDHDGRVSRGGFATSWRDAPSGLRNVRSSTARDSREERRRDDETERETDTNNAAPRALPAMRRTVVARNKGTLLFHGVTGHSSRPGRQVYSNVTDIRPRPRPKFAATMRR